MPSLQKSHTTRIARGRAIGPNQKLRQNFAQKKRVAKVTVNSETALTIPSFTRVEPSEVAY